MTGNLPHEIPRCEMRVAFLARSLDAGGAERQLVTLARGLKERGDDVTVILFYRRGTELEMQLLDSQVRVVTIGKKGRWDVVGFMYRLYRQLRTEPVDLLHGYLVVPNILVSILQLLFPRIATVWGIRASDMDLSQYDWLARVTFRASCWLSRVPDLIISNSEAGRLHHLASGYRPRKMEVVPNGIDTDYFAPDPIARRRLRTEWNVSQTTPLIGMVARLDPMKDHRTFLRAAGILLKEIPEARFVCVGDGPARYRRQLLQFCERQDLLSKVIWTGNRVDLPAIYSALDLLTLTSSSGEGFPNVVAEAMACGVPVVATAVGDTREIMGPLGATVQPGKPTQLKDAWLATLRNSRIDADKLRDRVVRQFSTGSLIETSRHLLIHVVNSH